MTKPKPTVAEMGAAAFKMPFGDLAGHEHLTKLASELEASAAQGRDLTLKFRPVAPVEIRSSSLGGKMFAMIEAMTTQQNAAIDAALLSLVPEGGELADLLGRTVVEQRAVGPATPAPAGSLPRRRIVLDGVPVWECGWDAMLDTRTPPTDAFPRVTGWAFRERWLDGRTA